MLRQRQSAAMSWETIGNTEGRFVRGTLSALFNQCLDGQRNGRRALLEQFQLLQQHLPLPTSLLMISDRGTYSADHVHVC
jgi:hypothetical protein